jgi:hypothetical protein
VHSSGHNRLQEFRFEYVCERQKIYRTYLQHQLQVIVSECNSANCFSVIADETTDVSTTEQISLCVRYVGVDSGEEMCVNESFQMSSQNLISLGPVVNKSYEIAFLFGVTA